MPKIYSGTERRPAKAGSPPYESIGVSTEVHRSTSAFKQNKNNYT